MKKRGIITVLILLLGISFGIALMSGTYTMSIGTVVKTLFGMGNKLQHAAIFQLRLPRMFAATFVGIALATSGCILQSVTQNPLAEPGMIGINAGAALAIVLLISFNNAYYYSAIGLRTVLLMPVYAVIGAFVAAVLMYLLAYRKGIAPTRLILVGVGVNAGINVLIVLYQLHMSKGDYNQALTWISGSLWGSKWMYVGMLAPVVVILAGMAIYKNKVLDILNMGDEIATGLGIEVPKERKRLLALATALAAVATAVAGNIAFLALLGPHIAKSLVGPVHKIMIPVSWLISISLLVLADTASRNLFSPLEIPVGITVSIIGVPYFIYLMMKEK